MDDRVQQTPREWEKATQHEPAETWELMRLADDALYSHKSKDEFLLSCASDGKNFTENEINGVFDLVSLMRKYTSTISTLGKIIDS